MTDMTPDALRALADRLSNWTTDWDGSKMAPGEPPRDGLHCDDLDDAAATLRALADEKEAARDALGGVSHE